MIIVTNNSSNTISMSLQDFTLTGSTSTGYTLNLQNEYTNETFTGITLTDLSSYPERYSQFTFILTGLTSVDYTSTKVYLKDDGYYKYKVYYNTSDDSELLEEGYMLVLNTEDVIDTYSYTDNDLDDTFSYEN